MQRQMVARNTAKQTAHASPSQKNFLAFSSHPSATTQRHCIRTVKNTGF